MFRGDSRDTAQRAVQSRTAAAARANPLAEEHFPALDASASRGGPLSRGSWGSLGNAAGAGAGGGESWPALGPQPAAGGGIAGSASRSSLAGAAGWGSRGSLAEDQRALGSASAFPSLIASSSSASLSGPPRPQGMGVYGAPPPPAAAEPSASASSSAAAAAAPPAASAESDEAAQARRRKLAEAFGISDPDHRPSMFASASAAVFSPEVIKARARSLCYKCPSPPITGMHLCLIGP